MTLSSKVFIVESEAAALNSLFIQYMPNIVRCSSGRFNGGQVGATAPFTKEAQLGAPFLWREVRPSS